MVDRDRSLDLRGADAVFQVSEERLIAGKVREQGVGHGRVCQVALLIVGGFGNRGKGFKLRFAQNSA